MTSGQSLVADDGFVFQIGDVILFPLAVYEVDIAIAVDYGQRTVLYRMFQEAHIRPCEPFKSGILVEGAGQGVEGEDIAIGEDVELPLKLDHASVVGRAREEVPFAHSLSLCCMCKPLEGTSEKDAEQAYMSEDSIHSAMCVQVVSRWFLPLSL